MIYSTMPSNFTEIWIELLHCDFTQICMYETVLIYPHLNEAVLICPNLVEALVIYSNVSDFIRI